jgi:hypothetical protein
MGQRTLTASFNVSWKQTVVAFLAFLYVVTNMFRVGGNAFISNLNNILTIPLTLGVVLLAFQTWRQANARVQNRLLWPGLAIGWTIWTVAEFWWAIADIAGEEIPYPSGADFFWLAGYIPMFVALWGRFRSLPHNRTAAQSAGIWASVILSTGWTIFFVLIPIMRDNDPSDILMSALNIIYPLVDLVLLVPVLQILFAYQQGMYGRAWFWLSAGFVLHSLSNLLFSYATTLDLYYPDGQANLLSTVGIDVPYNLSYLLWLIGLYIVRTIQLGHRAFTDVHFNLASAPNTHILVSTKGDDTIIEVSQNYWQVFPLEILRGKTLLEAIGVSPEDASSLIGGLKENHVAKERELLVNTSSGRKPALVSGISIQNPQGEYSGVSLLLRMTTDGDGLDDLLTEYQRGMVSSLLSKTGTKEKEEAEIKDLLSNYYLLYLKGIYNRVFSEGGSIMTDALLADLQATARRHGWQVGNDPDHLLDVSAMSLATTREALPVLFETARQFVTKTIDEPTVNTIVQDIRSQLGDRILKRIDRFEREETIRI